MEHPDILFWKVPLHTDLERLQDHALSISQCEQMALDAVEGEQKLNYTEGRREHVWRLLQGEGILAPSHGFRQDR